MKKSLRSSALDLTQGNPMRLLILFALPMLAGSVFQLFYNMVDTVVLGKFVSAEALASVGATSSTYSMFVMAANAITNALSILVSQAWGAKDGGQVKRTVAHALYMTLLGSAVFGLAAFFSAEPMMRLLGTPPNIIEGSICYIRITCGLMIASLFYNAAASILRAIGDSRTPLYFLILCSLLNIALDLAFVLWLHAGVAGVAWATVIAQLVSSLLCIAYMWKRYPELRFTREHMPVQRALLGSFFRIAGPMLLQNLTLSVGMLVITRVINSFGSDVVAAYTVGSKVEQLITVTFSQVAFSFSIYAGQNYGARAYGRIGLGMRKAGLLLSGLIALSMTVMLLFARPLALLFVNGDQAAILSSSVQMIRIEAVFLPALGAIWLFNSCLRGIGAVAPTVISSVVELLSKIGLSLLLSSLWGSTGIWFAAPVGWVLGLAPSMLYYFFGGWMKRAVSRDMAQAGDSATAS